MLPQARDWNVARLQIDLEVDRQVANTLADLIPGGMLASTEISRDDDDGASMDAAA